MASVPLMSAKSFLGLDVDRREPVRSQRGGSLDAPTGGVRNPSLAEQYGGDSRERRQVARGTEGPVLGHPGDDAGREQSEECFDQFDPDARQTRGQGPRAQQDHSPDHLVVEARAGSRRVAQNDRPLEQGAVRWIDRPVRQRPEAGGDAIHGCALTIETVDDFARRPHPVADAWIQGHGLAPTRGTNHGIDAQRAAVHSDHSASSLLVPGPVDPSVSGRPEA